MIIYVVQDRRIQLRELHMWMTYGGLLAGSPHKRLNEDLLENHEGLIADEAKKLDLRSHLIVPKAIPYEVRPGVTEESLPNVVCWGVFESGPSNKSYDASRAVFGWYQQEVVMPPFEAIKDLVWEGVARDVDF